jgi:hypothetical protein
VVTDIKTLISRADGDADLAGSVVLTEDEWKLVRGVLTGEAHRVVLEAARGHLLAFRHIATFREFKEAHAGLRAALAPYYPDLNRPL